jgi:hypothetical protein
LLWAIALELSGRSFFLRRPPTETALLPINNILDDDFGQLNNKLSEPSIFFKEPQLPLA